MTDAPNPTQPNIAPNESPISSELLTAWHNASEQASRFALLEKQLRNEIFTLAFPNPTPGTNKVRIGHGMALVGDYRMNYKIDRPLLEAMQKEPTIAPIIHEIVTYRPEIKEGAWKALPQESKLLVAAAITQTPGTPGLEIKPAAKLRWK